MMYKHTMIGLVNRSTTICLLSRLFSSANSSDCVLLAEAIDSIYNDDWRVRGVLPFRKDRLLEQIITRGSYSFSPIDRFLLKKSDFLDELVWMEESRGFISTECVMDHDSWIHVYKCRHSTDSLLMLALSKVLLNTVIGHEAPPNLTKLRDLMASHYDFIDNQHRVAKLVKIDLSPCMKTTTKSRILACFMNDSRIKGLPFNLLKQVVDLPIYDIQKNQFIPFNGMTPIGEITNVIFHLFYKNVFDNRIEEKYPGITYTRCAHEVLIAIKEYDEFTFDEDSAYNLLDEIDLDGDFDSICLNQYEGLPTCNEEKVIYLLDDGRVDVWRAEDV